MKQNLLIVTVLVLGVATFAAAQEMERTNVTTTTTTVSEGSYLLDMWQFKDTTPIDTRQVDLRIGFAYKSEDEFEYDDGDFDLRRWVEAFTPDFWNENRGGIPRHGSDDFALIKQLVWGCCPDVEVSVSTLHNLGDGWQNGDGVDGNHDATIGVLWRFLPEDTPVPSMALQAKARIPSGYRSSGIDGELRLLTSHHCTDWMRAHLNGYLKTVNGDNDVFARDFQWGLVLGADGPLCADGAVRWVADYAHTSSYHYGVGDVNQGELGWEWTISPEHRLGMNFQIGLDGNDDTTNIGAKISYAYSLRY